MQPSEQKKVTLTAIEKKSAQAYRKFKASFS